MALFALTLLLVVDHEAHPRRMWSSSRLPSCGLTSTAASSWRRPCSRLPGSPTSRNGPPRAHLALAVATVTAVACCLTPFGPSVWVYAARARREPGRDGPDQRMAADCAGRHLRSCSMGRRCSSRPISARRGRPTAWPTLLWLGFFFVIGAYAARDRVVAVRRRGRRRAAHRRDRVAVEERS